MGEKLAAAEIQQEMRRLRSEIRDDVLEVVDSAQTIADWRFYVRTYPWACVGVAVLGGYLLTPNKPQIVRPDADTLAKLAKRHQLVVEPDPVAKPKQTLGQSIFSLAANMMVRGLMGYVGQQLGKVLQPADQQTQSVRR